MINFYTHSQFNASGTTGSIEATLTTGAREYLARSLVEGLAFEVSQFSVGTDGWDPSDPLDVDPIVYASTGLGNEIFRADIPLINRLYPALEGIDFYIRLPSKTLSNQPIGEMGLWALILNSPLMPSEVGTWFLFAVVHTPMQVKTNNHVFTMKVHLVL